MSEPMFGYDAPAVLRRAAQLLQERGKQYDAQDGATPAGRERSMARVVGAFNALHGTSLTEAQGWTFMLLLKLVRLFCAPGFTAPASIRFSPMGVSPRSRQYASASRFRSAHMTSIGFFT